MLSYTISTSCEEPTIFPWYPTYLVFSRFLVISQSTTFLFMAFAKVILSWRADLYIKLNSETTINIATVVAVSVILVDNGLRFSLHIMNDCKDNLMLMMFQSRYKSEMCYAETYNESVELNSTLIENSTIATSNESDKCFSYPTIRVLVLGIIVLEFIKLILGFLQMTKKFKRKYKQSVLANQLNLTNIVDTVRVISPDIELSEINKTSIYILQELDENLDHPNNLPSSSSSNSNTINARINISQDSGHQRCLAILDQKTEFFSKSYGELGCNYFEELCGTWI